MLVVVVLVVAGVVVLVVVAVVIVVVVARGKAVLFEIETDKELSTSMATTSAGEEPHETQTNKENAIVGQIMCRSRRIITRD